MEFWKFQEKKHFFLKISKFLKELLKEFQKNEKFSKFLKELSIMPLFKVWGSIHFRLYFFYVKKIQNLGFVHFLNDWSRFSKIGENFPGLLFNFLNFKNTFVFEFSIFSFVFRSGQIRTCPDLSGFVRILSEKLEKN